MKQPLISVIVPAYNAEKTLRQCIESILTQTYEDVELVLVDDGSSDTTPSICDEFNDTHNVKVIHKQNAGSALARMDGFRQSSGEYVYFCDADDSVPSHALSQLYSKAVEMKCDMVVGCCNEVSDDNSYHYLRTWQVEGLIDSEQYCKALLLSKVSQGPACRLIRRCVISGDAFVLPKDIFINEDLFMNLCIGLSSDVVYVDNAIVSYTYTVDNGSSVRLTRQQSEEAWYSLFQKIMELYRGRQRSLPVPTFSEYVITTLQDVFFSRNRAVRHHNSDFLKLIKQFSAGMQRDFRYYKAIIFLRCPWLTGIYPYFRKFLP